MHGGLYSDRRKLKNYLRPRIISTSQATSVASPAPARPFPGDVPSLCCFSFFFTALIYFGASFSPSLMDDADSMHAQAAKEMPSRGDWVTLHVNGVRNLEKAHSSTGPSRSRIAFLASISSRFVSDGAGGRAADHDSLRLRPFCVWREGGTLRGDAIASCIGSFSLPGS
jgi:hypothetical protein